MERRMSEAGCAARDVVCDIAGRQIADWLCGVYVHHGAHGSDGSRPRVLGRRCSLRPCSGGCALAQPSGQSLGLEVVRSKIRRTAVTSLGSSLGDVVAEHIRPSD